MPEPRFASKWPTTWLLAAISAFSFWSTAAVEICSMALLVLFLLFHARDGVSVIRSVPVLLWALYLSGVVISILLSQYREQSYGYFNKLWHAALFLVAIASPWSDGELTLPGWTFTVSAAAAAGASLAHSLSTSAPFAEPFFQGLTTYSSLLAMAGIVCLYRLLSGQIAFTFLPVLNLLIYIIITCGVFFSARFSASLVLIVGSALIVLALRPKLMIHWLVSIALLIAISPDALRFKFSWIVSGGQTDRYVLWDSGRNLLAHLPLFGFGPSSSSEIIPEAAKLSFAYGMPSSWHNDFLQVFLESGWIAGTSYLLLAGVVIFGGIRRFMQTTDAQERRSLVLGTVLMGGMIFFAASDAVVSTAVLGVTWWLIIGRLTRLGMKKGRILQR